MRQADSVRVKPLMVVAIGILAIAFSAVSGEPPAPSTTPRAALDKLEPLLGTWASEGIYKRTPDAQPFHGKVFERVYWSKDRLFLISDQWAYLPAGWAPRMVITAWDPIEQKYRVTHILPTWTDVTLMTLEGDHRYEESKEGGHTTKLWASSEQVSPDKKKFRIECSIDDGPKWTFCEGTAIRKSNP